MTLNKTIFQTFAAKYYELGFNPIPVLGKIPAVEGWQVFCTRRMDEVELNQLLWTVGENSAVGVGFALGLGCWALDVDSNDERLLDKIPFSPMTKIGMKGRTAIYRWHNDKMPRGMKPRCTVGGEKYRLPIELLSVGSQTVVPPSSHPDGGTYVWSAGSEECSVSDLPLVDPIKVMDELKAFCIQHSILIPLKVRDMMPETELEGGELKIGIGGRNNILTSVAYAKVCTMNINLQTREDLARELLEYDEKMHGKAAWFKDEKEHKDKKSPIDRAQSFVDRAIANAEKKGDIFPKMELYIAPEIAIEEVEESDNLTDALRLEPTDQMIESLMDQVPFLALFRHDLKKRAPQYSSSLCLNAGLSVLSAMSGNTIELNGQRSNMFFLSVATSSDGKDAPQAMVRDIMVKVKQQTGIIIATAESYKSTAVVRKNMALNKRHIKFDVQDEVGYLFSRMNNQQSAVFGIIDVLNKMFTASNKVLGADDAQHKDYKIEPIANPSLTLLGATTFTGMKDLVKSSNILKGVGGRFLYMMQKVDIDRLPQKAFKVRDTSLSKELINQVCEWITIPPELDEDKSIYHNINISEHEKRIICKQLEMTSEAEDLVDEWVRSVSEIKAVAIKSGMDIEADPFLTIIGRSIELVYRLCLLWYVGWNGERQIDADAVRWATSIVRISQWNISQYLDVSYGSVLEQVCQAVLVRFRKNNKSRPSSVTGYWMCRADNYRAIIDSEYKKRTDLNMHKSDRDEVINRLKTAGIVEHGRYVSFEGV